MSSLRNTSKIAISTTVTGLATLFLVTSSFAQSSCDLTKPSLELRRCIANFVIKSPSYLGKCVYSNAGRILLKGQNECQLDCGQNTQKFAKDWAGPQECVDTNGPLRDK
jgi:hypothetical protein